MNRAKDLNAVADQKDGLLRQQALQLIDRLERERNELYPKLIILLQGRSCCSGGVGSGNNIVTKVKYGDHFTKVGRKKVVKPNVEYTTIDGYTYRTDSQGRIISIEGTLVLGTAERSEYAQRTVGGPERLFDDDGGHLIGAQLKGRREFIILFLKISKLIGLVENGIIWSRSGRMH